MSVRPENSLVSQFAEMVGYFTIAFSFAVASSYAYFAFRKRRFNSSPLSGGTLRLRTPSGVYRARFLRTTSEGWVFSAPLKRDAYVPLRPGESVTAECPTENGVLLFRSHVVSRDAETHEFTIEKPKATHARERRSGKRARVSNVAVDIDSIQASLVDISEGGARAVVARRFANGERVAVKLPWIAEPVYAAVLETEITDGRGLFATRIVFEEPIKVNWSSLRFAVEA